MTRSASRTRSPSTVSGCRPSGSSCLAIGAPLPPLALGRVRLVVALEARVTPEGSERSLAERTGRDGAAPPVKVAQPGHDVADDIDRPLADPLVERVLVRP